MMSAWVYGLRIAFQTNLDMDVNRECKFLCYHVDFCQGTTYALQPSSRGFDALLLTGHDLDSCSFVIGL